MKISTIYTSIVLVLVFNVFNKTSLGNNIYLELQNAENDYIIDTLSPDPCDEDFPNKDTLSLRTTVNTNDWILDATSFKTIHNIYDLMLFSFPGNSSNTFIKSKAINAGNITNVIFSAGNPDTLPGPLKLRANVLPLDKIIQFVKDLKNEGIDILTNPNDFQILFHPIPGEDSLGKACVILELRVLKADKSQSTASTRTNPCPACK